MKIEEVKAENPVLKTIFELMESKPDENKVLPFEAQSMGLSPADVEVLDRHGVVLVEGQSLLMPEIYRQGLKFKLTNPGRAQVRKLKKMAQRKAQAGK